MFSRSDIANLASRTKEQVDLLAKEGRQDILESVAVEVEGLATAHLKPKFKTTHHYGAQEGYIDLPTNFYAFTFIQDSHTFVVLEHAEGIRGFNSLYCEKDHLYRQVGNYVINLGIEG